MYPAAANIHSMPASAGAVLISVTLVLSAALMAQVVVRRSAAARHAILFWALVAVGVTPIVLLASDLWSLTPVFRLPDQLSLQKVMHSTAEPTTYVPQRLGGEAPAGFWWLDVLWTIWLIGALVGFVRIAHGLLVSRQLGRTAVPMTGENVAATLDRAAEVLGRPAPQVLASHEIAVPATIGFFRPVVLVPWPLVVQLDQSRLLHVLLHECAHIRRHDSLVGLYQRVLATLLWFHPLIHLNNRLLDGVREELCDNHVLRVASATDYTRTLLFVARSVTKTARKPLITTLFGSVRQLEKRVAQLLTPGRISMTHLKLWKSAAIAAAFLCGACLLTSFATTPTAKSGGYDLSRKVDFKVGATYLLDGDNITVDEITGTSDAFAAGNVYVVKGTYRLGSQESASLAAYVTVDSRSHRSVPTQNTQTMIVEKGKGRYSLIFYMWDEGYPHVSFYPAKRGSSFASVYFGTANTLLERGWWEKTQGRQGAAGRPGIEITHPPIAGRHLDCASCHDASLQVHGVGAHLWPASRSL